MVIFSENFQFLVVNFSVYLNRHVWLMSVLWASMSEGKFSHLAANLFRRRKKGKLSDIMKTPIQMY